MVLISQNEINSLVEIKFLMETYYDLSFLDATSGREFELFVIELFEKYREIFLDDSTSSHHYLKFVIKTIAFMFIIVLYILLVITE